MIPTRARTSQGAIADALSGLAEPETLRLLGIGVAASVSTVAIGLLGATYFASLAIGTLASPGGSISAAFFVFAAIQSFAITGLPLAPLPAEAIGIASLEARLVIDASDGPDSRITLSRLSAEIGRLVAAVQIWWLPVSLGSCAAVLGATRLASAAGRSSAGLQAVIASDGAATIVTGAGLLLAALWLLVFLVPMPVWWASVLTSRLASRDFLGFLSARRIGRAALCLQGCHTKHLADNGARYVIAGAAVFVVAAVLGFVGVSSAILVLGLWVALSTASSLAYYDYLGTWFGNDLVRIITHQVEPTAFQHKRGRELLVSAAVLGLFAFLMIAAAASVTLHWYQEWSNTLAQVIDALSRVVKGV